MELFSNDRDRLAFLLETDAALDLDFEALEARGREAADEEPAQRPSYITNYIGSKQKLVEWIWKHTPDGVSSVLDAFSGSAVAVLARRLVVVAPFRVVLVVVVLAASSGLAGAAGSTPQGLSPRARPGRASPTRSLLCSPVPRSTSTSCRTRW